MRVGGVRFRRMNKAVLGCSAILAVSPAILGVSLALLVVSKSPVWPSPITNRSKAWKKLSAHFKRISILSMSRLTPPIVVSLRNVIFSVSWKN